jgi:hypothetical protein
MLDFLQLTYSKLAPNGAVIIFMSIIKVESIIEIAQKLVSITRLQVSGIKQIQCLEI